MNYKKITVSNSSGKLSFSKRVDTSRPWWIDLDIDGEPAYRIGNMCDTCQAMFSRFKDINFSVTPESLRSSFGKGLEKPDQPIIDTVSHILPAGEYVVGLLGITPKLFSWEIRSYENSLLGSSYKMVPIYVWANINKVKIPTKYWPDAPIFPAPWEYMTNQHKTHNSNNDEFLNEAVTPLADEEVLY